MEAALEITSFIDNAAKRIAAKRLGVPVVLFLELHKPLFGIAHVAGEAFSPLLFPLLGRKLGEELLALLESRENVERLIEKIEFYRGELVA